MTDIEQNRFEAELRRTRPGSLPEDLRSRLLAATGPTKASPVALGPAPVVMGLQRVLRFLIPATAVAVLTIVVWRQTMQQKNDKTVTTAAPSVASAAPAITAEAANSAPALKPDEVQIAQDLISSFDTLATLPSGEPIRLQCREWMDKVTLSDRAHGLVFEERTPRVEVRAIGYDTY